MVNRHCSDLSPTSVLRIDFFSTFRCLKLHHFKWLNLARHMAFRAAATTLRNLSIFTVQRWRIIFKLTIAQNWEIACSAIPYCWDCRFEELFVSLRIGYPTTAIY